MLNSAKHKILTAYRKKILKNNILPPAYTIHDVVIILLIIVKMPTIVGILT